MRRTGMKCLPATKIPTSNGIVLHDWHAEIVALRAFNRFLLDECKALVKARDYASDWIERTAEEENGVDRDTSKETRRKERRPFKTRDGVKWHMYCSEAPCMIVFSHF
jgi:tRNA-specific adenosine deaminase 1